MRDYDDDDPYAMPVGGADVPRRMMIRSAAIEHRNTGLIYRELKTSRGRYPAWVEQLKGRSGVYVIREWHDDEPLVVYVGESHSGRLHEIMIRRFQKYRRDRVEVAVRITSAEDAGQEEACLIARLRPRDNARQDDDDDDTAETNGGLQ